MRSEPCHLELGPTRTASNIVIAFVLLCRGSTAAHAQRSDGQRIGVLREQLAERSQVARDTESTPTTGGHTRSNAKIGAIVGAYVGVVISFLAYKQCGEGCPQRDESVCGVELMLDAPVAMGGGAIVGGLIGRAHPTTR